MGLAKHAHEVTTSRFYRHRPVEAVRYAMAKRLFSQFRVEEPDDILTGLGIDPNEAMRGYESWRPLLEQVVADVTPDQGRQCGVSIEDGQVLYGIVRALRPGIVIETGVAAGVSHSFICAALIENGTGHIYSIDLPPEQSNNRVHDDGSTTGWAENGVGWAIPPAILCGIGERRTILLEDVASALPALLDRLPPVDIFFHDDLHTPDHMLWEFELVWPHLRAGGVLVADDVNAGWVTFCRRNGLPVSSFRNIQRLAAIRK